MKIKAYDLDDILDPTLSPSRSKKTFDSILRPRLKHINAHETGRAKTKVILGMVKHIVRFMMRAIVREILDGEVVEMKGIGTIRMSTYQFNNRYKGYSVARQKQKETNRYDTPVLLKKDKTLCMYYVSTHGKTTKLLNKKIEAGAYYRRKPD